MGFLIICVNKKPHSFTGALAYLNLIMLHCPIHLALILLFF